MKEFWKAFLLVAVPIIFLSVISTLGGDINDLLFHEGAPLLFIWLVGAVAWLVGVGFLIFSLVRGKSQTALGILAGLAVGSVALALTCMANSRGL